MGRDAIGRFLTALQAIKSTGDHARAVSFFGGYSKVPEDMLALRPIVIARKSARPIYHMALLRDVNGEIEIHETPSTAEGVVEAYIERYRDVAHLVNTTDKDLAFFTL